MSDPNIEWHQLVAFGMTATPIPNMRESDLINVATTYQRNIQRIKAMLAAPSALAVFAREFQRCYDISELALTSKFDGSGQITGLENSAEITQKAVHLFDDIERTRKAQEVDQQGRQALMIERMNLGTATLSALLVLPNPTSGGLEAMTSSALIGYWTAFETMAADLWEASLNVHPQGLAELKGKRKRMLSSKDSDQDITSTTEDEDEAEMDVAKTVPLAHISRYQFDITDKMGTILRGRQRFDHLAGIREAYGLAFHKNFEGVHKAIRSEVLDALNAVRNLIVHRNGVVDSTYSKKAKYLKVPQASQGQMIRLQGTQVVYDLLAPMLLCSLELLKAVDDWIAAN